jgi:hypothetical protein
MRRLFRFAGFSLAFLAIGSYVGWKALIAWERWSAAAEFRKLSGTTAANIYNAHDLANPDGAFRIYAVNVVHTHPFEKPFIGFGVYLGKGAVLTASHVVGNWPFFTDLRVFIAGRNLPAKVIKQGPLEKIDLTLISVDEGRLPAILKLRRNPLCKGPLRVNAKVVVVYPGRLVRATIISPLSIAPPYEKRFGSLINEPEVSGSGVFDATRKCLLGIISRKIPKVVYRREHDRLIVNETNDFAGYFVPASRIAGFLPPDFRF